MVEGLSSVNKSVGFVTETVLIFKYENVQTIFCWEKRIDCEFHNT